MPAVNHSTRNASSSKHNYSIVSASEVMGRGAKVIAIITVDGLWMNVCCWNARAELDCCGIFLLFHLKPPNNRRTSRRMCRFRPYQMEQEALKSLQQSMCVVLEVLFLFWIITVTFQCFDSERTWIVGRLNRMARETWKHHTSYLSEDAGHSAY